MAWWTTVPALTPLVAHDALRVNATHFLDGLGVNHMGLGGCVLAEPYPYPVYQGAGGALPYTSAVAMPATGVVCAFYKAGSASAAFHKTLGGNSLMQWEASTTISSSGSGGTGALATLGLGELRFMALVKSATTSQLYVDGALIGTAIPNAQVPDSLGGMGLNTQGNPYNFDSGDRFAASGVFSGATSLADVQALEAALRAELAAPQPTTQVAQMLPLRSSAGGQATGAPNTSVVDAGQARVRLSAGFVGVGSIEGVVTVNAVPSVQLVRLFDKDTAALVATTQSALDGSYAFTGLDAPRWYFVTAHDTARQYNAVISDMIYVTSAA